MVPYMVVFSHLILCQRFWLGHADAYTCTRPHIETMNLATGQFPTEGVYVMLSGYYWSSDGPIYGCVFTFDPLPTVLARPCRRIHMHTSTHRNDEPRHRPIPNGGCICNAEWLLLVL